jgi:nucleoside-diphosphate-sugar epimerase
LTTLIVGCGYVGSALAERLVEREPVLAITRTPRALPDRVEPLITALPDATLRLPNEIRRVVYAVAPDARTDEAYERAYPSGLGSVLDALKRSEHELDRIVLVSSIAVHAEESRATSQWIVRAEEKLSSLDHFFDRASGDEPGVVARLSGIYGPGRDRLVREIRAGRVPGDPSRIGNRIHRDDAAAAIEHLLLLPRPFRPSYDVTDSAPVPLGEVYEWIARRVGVELDPSATAVGSKLTGKRIDNAPLLASGFALRYPTYREGYGELIASA